MHAPSLASGFNSDSSPRWLVTNGTTTVGPVHTELLLRGYLGGRIPEHCHVREVRWGAWRPLERIREIGSLKRRLARDGAPLGLREAAHHLPRTSDPGELLSSALQLAALTLDANAGLLHRYRAPLSLLVTSAVFGVPAELLGDVLPESDPSYVLAKRGKGFCGNPRHGLGERLVAERLQHDAPLASVLMVPVMTQGRLLAILELGRTGHVFRVDDADDLAALAAEVARRLD
ncbi:MAG: GAF domain-containing protein [Myxococcales bacterium]|nr:MAG: GAF domain-containing protein [Myxococcales bacterium]